MNPIIITGRHAIRSFIGRNSRHSLSLRRFSTALQNHYKVAVIGSAGGIGRPLSLLLKLEPMVTHIGLHDIAKSSPGLAVDLSHINTKSQVEGYAGDKEIKKALCGAHIVVIATGTCHGAILSQEELFKADAHTMFDITYAVAQYNPYAFLVIVSNPVNVMVPLVSEALIRFGHYDPCRIFGITTLDIMRANTIVAGMLCVNPTCVDVPVIGGRSITTMIPVLSRSKPELFLTQKEIEALTKKIQNAECDVLCAKGTNATLSCAFAVYKFVRSLLLGLEGQYPIDVAFVRSVATKAAYFSTPITLGECGICYNHGFGKLSVYEMKQAYEAAEKIKQDTAIGAELVKNIILYKFRLAKQG